MGVLITADFATILNAQVLTCESVCCACPIQAEAAVFSNYQLFSCGALPILDIFLLTLCNYFRSLTVANIVKTVHIFQNK